MGKDRKCKSVIMDGIIFNRKGKVKLFWGMKNLPLSPSKRSASVTHSFNERIEPHGLDIFFQKRKMIIEIYPPAASVNRFPVR